MPDGREWIYNKIRALVLISSVKDCLLLFLVSRWWDPHSFKTGLVSLHFSILVPHNFHGPTGHYISTDNYIVFRGPILLKEIYEGGGYIQSTILIHDVQDAKREDGYQPSLFRSCVPTPCPSSDLLRGKKRKFRMRKRKPWKIFARNSKSRKAELFYGAAEFLTQAYSNEKCLIRLFALCLQQNINIWKIAMFFMFILKWFKSWL